MYSLRWNWPIRPEAVLAVEQPADRHQRTVVGEALRGALEEAGVERGVGVHDHHAVVVALAGEDLRERLVEAAGLLVRVVDRLVDVDAGLAGQPDRAVGAVVRDDHDPRGRQRLRLQRGQGLGDAALLVVRRDEDGDGHLSGVLAAGLGHHELGGEGHPVAVLAAAGAGEQAPLDAGDPGREQQGDAHGGEQHPRRGHLGVVEDPPDPEQESFVGGAAGLGVPRGDGHPQGTRPSAARPMIARPTDR